MRLQLKSAARNTKIAGASYIYILLISVTFNGINGISDKFKFLGLFILSEIISSMVDQAVIKSSFFCIIDPAFQCYQQHMSITLRKDETFSDFRLTVNI